MANAKGRAASQGPEALYVQGFQVFEERTRIPLRRLTFLFGPNSAGKSGVEDALVVLRNVVFGSDFDGTFEGRFASLRRHWRRTGEGAFDYAPLLALGYIERVSEDIARLTQAHLRGEPTRLHDESDVLREVELSARFRCGNFAESEHEWDPELYRDLEVAVDGDGIVSMIEFEKFGVNCGHAILSGLARKDELVGLSESWPAFVEVKGNWVYFKGDWVRVDAKKHIGTSTLGLAMSRLRQLGGTTRNHLTKASPEVGEQWRATRGGVPDDLLSGFERLASLYNAIWDATTSGLRLDFEVVPASRKVPTERELMFLVGAERDSFCTRFSALSRPPPQSGTNFLDLATSFAAASLAWDMEFSYGDFRQSEKVNRALADHLFAERGYRVAAEFRLLLKPEVLNGSGVTREENSDEHHPALVRLFLVDAQGREFLFEDVGSGLGYVLPVLCAVYRESWWLTLLQQPELHLHPALQAALGDVLIDATADEPMAGGQSVRGPRRLLIETHSEHLLLRVLKRIRQSARTPEESKGLAIGAEEVCVLYFDPLMNGTTKVKRLRIAPDGEFMDRWPKGFFTEREGELFDGDE